MQSSTSKLFTSLVEPILDYGSPIYGLASKFTFQLLDTIQSTALHIATVAFRTSPLFFYLFDQIGIFILVIRCQVFIQMFFSETAIEIKIFLPPLK